METMKGLRADPEHLKSIVKHLALSIGPRPYSRPKVLEAARDYIRQKLEASGLKTSLQGFRYRNNLYWNILLAQDNPLSTDYGPEGVIVVGAHYDTVSRSPGADDNASGIAGLIELSRLLGKDLPKNLILVAFCLEEPPCYRTQNMGSYKFAHFLRKKNTRVNGMICIEMIGYFVDTPRSQQFPLPFMNKVYPDKGNFIGLVGNLKSRGFTERVKASFLKEGSIPVESLNAPFLVIGVDLSDHWSFYKFGYDAVMVTDTAFYRNPHYHRPTDLPETLDYEKMAGVVDALKRAALDLCAR